MANKDFVGSWNRSTQPRKQRKYRYNAPLHVRQKLISSHLSPELRKKYGCRNVAVRTGDKVRVMRGQFAKKEGKVERVNLKREEISVFGMDVIKRDGTKLLAAIHPSNIMIIELNLSDKKRKESLERSNHGLKDNAEARKSKEAK
ncbi:50S ribosomal protein L24 [Candidatus Woesearchaeota archaeon]|nr:50S ribosomal protein L24 [Candidatus Woesearchaeota archaeon]